MFGFFRKNKENIEKQKELITITDENGNQVEVDKDEWLENVFKPFIEENQENQEAILDMLDLAISYKVKEVVIYASIEYDRSKDIASIDRLFKAYELNGLDKEAADLYEEFGAHKLTSYMYYDLAKAKEKLGDMQNKKKYLYLAFNSNNNNEKALKELLAYELETSNPNEYYEKMVSLNQESNSCYLSKELAKMQYKMKKDVEATNNIAKALKEARKNEKQIKEIARILLENNKLNEFENYIIPKYDKNTDNMSFHNLIQSFYFRDKQYKKGLDTLKELYKNGKYSERFAENEKYFLRSKMFEENYARYGKIVSCRDDENDNLKPLLAPIYSKQLNLPLLDKKKPNIIILPTTVDVEVGSFKESIKNIIKNLSSYLFDIVYINSDINIKSAFMYNSLGAKLNMHNYEDSFFAKIKEKNEDVDYILSAQISEIDEENFKLKFYVYDFSKNKRIELYETKTSVSNLAETLKIFINNIIPNVFEVVIKKVEKKDVNYLDVYSNYLEIFLNVNKENEFKIYTIENTLRNLLKEPNEHKINLALSTVKIIGMYLPEIKDNYKSKIYDVILFNKYLGDMLTTFKMVYGE